MKRKPRCPECGALVNKDGSHKLSTFTECSRRKRVTAGTASWSDAAGHSNTFGWEDRHAR